jgi:regulator of sigma E protease
MQILAGIILLGILIIFHELGHFLFAKWLGVRVLVFSVGFGPKIWGFKKGETEYRLSAIPLGGYVRMFGESLEDELTAEEKKMSFMHQAIWRKSLIAFAGPLFNFILPIILFFFLLIGIEQVFAPRVGTLVSGGVAEKAGILPDDLIIAVNDHPVHSFNEIADIVARNPNIDISLRIKREIAGSGYKELDLIVKPEAKTSFNPLEKDQAIGRIGIMPAIELPIVTVFSGSPLKEAGLHSFDEIIAIDNKNITSANELISSLAMIKPSSKMTIKRYESDDKNGQEHVIKAPENLTISREKLPVKIINKLSDNDSEEILHLVNKTKWILLEEQTLLLNNLGISLAKGSVREIIVDSIAYDLGLRIKDRIVAMDGEKLISSIQLQQKISHKGAEPHILGVIKNDKTPIVYIFTMPDSALDQVDLNADLLNIFGISTVPVFKSGELIERRVNPLEAIKRATTQTANIVLMTGKSLWLLVKREVPASQIGGPIMLFDVAQQAAKKGLHYYIFIMCLLSVNLGLLNLLPIPALDGGHLLLFGIESVQRKPLTQKTRAIATQIGIAILLMLMAFAIWNDLSRLFR